MTSSIPALHEVGAANAANVISNYAYTPTRTR